MVDDEKYVIGIDFGSLSCRAILVNTHTGFVAGESEYVYPHGVIDRMLPNGTELPPMWALQDPQDYLDALAETIKDICRKSCVIGAQIIAIGLDTTSSTVIPVDSEMRPLCMDDKFRNLPHAWPKMWKHHAAVHEAEAITKAASNAHLQIVDKYGGAVGAEFLIPKVIQVCLEAPEVYEAAETFIELGDWIASILCGTEIRSGSYLTCKSMWVPGEGYPSGEIFSEISEKLRDLPEKKLAYHNGSDPKIVWPGEKAGTLCLEMAEALGLSERTIITASQMDAYAGVPGCGIYDQSTLMMMIGTSTGYMLLDRKTTLVPGICAAMENSNLPGFTNYAAGQAGVGDIFGWFIKNWVPAEYYEKAKEANLNIHAYLSQLAESYMPGEVGLMALDWWNGNKSCLNNSKLSGLILGMDLGTRPEHIYRALIEATAYGARKIIENFEKSGVGINKIIACGGIAVKNPLLMQIYADVTGKKFYVSSCSQAAAMGSAIYAAAAAGSKAGGYDAISDAIKAMADDDYICYEPRDDAHEIYNGLYAEYIMLHDYFGCGGNRVMERMKEYKK